MRLLRSVDNGEPRPAEIADLLGTWFPGDSDAA
jgi:hypothetical protein